MDEIQSLSLSISFVAVRVNNLSNRIIFVNLYCGAITIAGGSMPNILGFHGCCHTLASTQENLSSGVCEQKRRRPACTSVQSDQRLHYSLIGKYHI